MSNEAMGKKKVVIINGPNLNLTGLREPEIYGKTGFQEYIGILKQRFTDTEIVYFQSNSEGAIIDELHKYGFDTNIGIVLNAGAYSHYSIAIADAIRAITVPVIEVHLSNIYSREEYRHNSVTAPACKGIIAGFGMQGYELAIRAIIND